MKRSIATQSLVGFLVSLSAAAVAPGCAQEGESLDQPALAVETAALVQGVDGLLQANCPPDVPAALVQIYTCAIPATGGAPAWTLKAPHAVLGKKNHDVQAIHFAGPSWQATDGSLVTATRAAASPAPDAADIPWLLLKATTHVGAGAFAPVTWIQRLATEKGPAPATGCDVAHLGTEVLVPYAADYFFDRPSTDGERIQQCAAR